MSAVQKGYGAFWSIGGVTFTAGIVSATNNGAVQSVDTSRSCQIADLKDDGGTIRGKAFHGFIKTISVKVVPYGSSIANGKTSAEAWLPQPGTAVTIADAAGTILDATYNVISAKQGRTVDGYVTADLELETSDEGVDITTTVA